MYKVVKILPGTILKLPAYRTFKCMVCICQVNPKYNLVSLDIIMLTHFVIACITVNNGLVPSNTYS